MTKQEKGLLLELLLLDIRGNWAFKALERACFASEIANELGLDKTINLINGYTNEIFEDGDGRHFRCNFETEGGYEGMEVIHNLTHTFHDKSEEFKKLALEHLTYPENIFDDWEDNK